MLAQHQKRASFRARLESALENQDVRAIEQLRFDSDFDSADLQTDHSSVLHYACQHGDSAVLAAVSRLLSEDLRAHLFSRADQQGHTPIDYVCHRGDAHLIRTAMEEHLRLFDTHPD